MPGRQRARLINERLEQRLQLDRRFFHPVGCALERGKEQQVADQSAHGLALAQDCTEVFAVRFFVELKRQQCLGKACNDRGGRPDFVRHVGHEIAAHRVQFRLVGDITGNQKPMLGIGFVQL